MNDIFVDNGSAKYVTLAEHLATQESAAQEFYCLMSWDETGVVFFSSETGWGALSDETDLHGHPFPTFVIPPAVGQPIKWIALSEAEAMVDIAIGCQE